MFSINYTQAETQEMLMRPIRITALMNELIALENDNVISRTVGSQVANLIFDEIQTKSTPMRADWMTMIGSIKDHSRHLYQTTDELNAAMTQSVNPNSDMSTYRIQVDRINEVYDIIRDGFDSATTMDGDYINLNTDFFAPSAIYKVDYANNYPTISHTANTISSIVTRIFEADSLYGEQQTKLADLRNSFPEIAVESFDSSKYKEAVYLPNSMYVKLLPDNLFRIYNDATLTTDIGSIFGTETLIANRQETYTIRVENCTAGQDTARRFMVINHLKGAVPASPIPAGTSPLPANTAIFISQNTSVNVLGSDIKSLAFEIGGGLLGHPQFGNANTTTGLDSVIRYTDLS